MIDKPLHVFLLAIAAIGGTAITLVSWLSPIPTAERVIVTLLAVIGMACAWIIH